MKTTQVEVKELKQGDRILDDNGLPVTITKIGKGIPRNTIYLGWKDGWTAQSPTTLVERVA